MGRLRRLVRELRAAGIEAALILNASNIFYLIGFPRPAYPGTTAALLVDAREGRGELIVPLLELSMAEDMVTEDVEIDAVKPGERFLEHAVRRLAASGADIIGVEMGEMSASAYRRIEGLLGGRPLKDVGPLLERMRMVKDEDELRRMRRAAEITIKAIREACEEARIGMKESRLAAIMLKVIADEGATLAFEPIVASGPRAAYPHGIFDGREIRQGDVVVIDVGARYEGYCADMTRVLLAGEAPAEARRALGALLKAQEAALERLRAGVTGGEVDQAARRVLEEAGFGEAFTHSLGHGVGIDVHEKPYLMPGAREKLPAGCVVTVEPGVYIKDRWGLRVEDMVLVKEDGYQNLTKGLERVLQL